MASLFHKHIPDHSTEASTLSFSSERVALDCLAASGWAVEGAIDYFFTNAHSQAAVPAANIKALDELFQKYKGRIECQATGVRAPAPGVGGVGVTMRLPDCSAGVCGLTPDPSDTMMLAEGVGQFCEDLEVDPTDIVLVRCLHSTYFPPAEGSPGQYGLRTAGGGCLILLFLDLF